jgi:hypothetical protein
MQTSAFNREDHRVDGKLHCWLCKLSYKRALAKAKKSDSEKHRHKKRSADEANLKSNSSHKVNSGSSNNRSNHNSQRPDVSKSGLSEIPEKISKTGNSGMIPTNSDHVVAMTQLKEQIATLQKRLQQKDNQLLQKDKEVSLPSSFSLPPSCDVFPLRVKVFVFHAAPRLAKKRHQQSQIINSSFHSPTLSLLTPNCR